MAEHEEKHGEHAEEHGASRGHGGVAHHGGGGHAEGEHEGAPEWLISFADNVALMMGFFVILLAMNMKAPKAQEGIGSEEGSGAATHIDPLDTVIAIREAFHSRLNPNDPRDLPLLEHKRKRGQGNVDEIGEEGQNRDVETVLPDDELYSDGGTIPFEEGAADLTETGRRIVAQVATKMRDSRWVIDVRGHAAPYETFGDANTGLELSFRRAQAVANALVDQGLKWEQLHVVACADSDRKRPRAGSRTEDAVNRRVEIVQTKETIPDDPYSAEGDE